MRQVLRELYQIDPVLSLVTLYKWGLEFTNQEIADRIGRSFDQTRRLLARARAIIITKVLMEDS